MNSRKLPAIFTLAVVIGIFGAAQFASAAAVDFFIIIEGSKQGQFHGEGAAGMTGRLAGSQFSYEESAASGARAGKVAANDKTTGATAGRRVHATVRIVREIDKASPLFARAVSTAEVLRSVDFEFVRNGASAKPEVYKTLHMSNVMITSIKPLSAHGERPMESITFVAETQDVIAKNMNGNKASMDDWSKQN